SECAFQYSSETTSVWSLKRDQYKACPRIKAPQRKNSIIVPAYFVVSEAARSLPFARLRFGLRRHRRKVLCPRHSWPHRTRGMRRLSRSRPGLPTCQAEHYFPSLSSLLSALRPVGGFPLSEYRYDRD